jgi:hypothetical protein
MTGTALMVIPQPKLGSNIQLRSPYPTLEEVLLNIWLPLMVEPDNEGFEQDPGSDALH